MFCTLSIVPVYFPVTEGSLITDIDISCHELKNKLLQFNAPKETTNAISKIIMLGKQVFPKFLVL